MFAVVAAVLFVLGWLKSGPAIDGDLLFAGLAFLAVSLVLDPFIIERTGLRRRV